ncbi:MAG: hypothetical protein ABIS86_19100, partial [Streptosporangiaceae bacterium]
PPDLDLGPRTISSEAASAVRSRTALIVGAIVAITALLVGGLMYVRSQDDSDARTPSAGTSSHSAAATTPSVKPTSSQSTSDQPTSAEPSSTAGTPKPSTSSTGEAAGGSAFKEHLDSSGYAVRIPKDYTGPQRRSEGDFFYAPDGRSYVQIAQTDNPGPSAIDDWRNLARGRGGDYEKIAIRPTGNQPPVPDTTGKKSADWEFKQGSTHILDRGFVLNGKGYAILLSAPDDGWSKFLDSMQPVFASFRSE